MLRQLVLKRNLKLLESCSNRGPRGSKSGVDPNPFTQPLFLKQARPRRRPAPAPCKETNEWKDGSWLIENSSGKVNGESVVMVNRYIFVVVNRESVVMVKRYIFVVVNRESVVMVNRYIFIAVKDTCDQT